MNKFYSCKNLSETKLILKNFIIFATELKISHMYNIPEAYSKSTLVSSNDFWEYKIGCLLTDAELTMATNRMPNTLEAYTITLVTNGNLTLTSNSRELTLHTNDIFFYLPGYLVKIKDVSPDYTGICLIIDMKQALDTPASKYMVQTAFFPLLEIGIPKVTISAQDAERMKSIMLLMHSTIHGDSIYKGRILKMLYSVLILDLMNLYRLRQSDKPLSEQARQLYLSFIRLLPDNFKEHHDIRFYADQLHVTPTYLSRVVKQVSSHTVLDFINQMLMLEASWMLVDTKKSIAEIADALHFSDQASFSKFFTRLQGVTPKSYRKKA